MSTPPLKPGELSLALLAAVAHPDEEFRLDFGRRLRAAIERHKPKHDSRSLRAFFRRQDRRRRCVRLSAGLRDLAVLVCRIAFSGLFSGLSGSPRHRLLIAPGDGDLQTGYLVTRSLEVISLARSAMTRHRILRRQEDCRFLPELARKRLARFGLREPTLRATCRVEDRMVLELTDDSPWQQDLSSMHASAELASATPATLGFAQERQGNLLRLWPATPEATLRFTAWLAQGHLLILEQAYRNNRDRRLIAVRLRDFDGDHASFRVLASPPPSESWLIGMPEINLELTRDDHAAIARWAHPLNDWMTNNLAEKLL